MLNGTKVWFDKDRSGQQARPGQTKQWTVRDEGMFVLRPPTRAYGRLKYVTASGRKKDSGKKQLQEWRCRKSLPVC